MIFLQYEFLPNIVFKLNISGCYLNNELEREYEDYLI
jgi:hypothetical protein